MNFFTNLNRMWNAQKNDEAGRRVVLVVAPMPPFPTSAGNRRRLLATCNFLKRSGYELDFAYVAHEDQIYRRFAQHPPTDLALCAGYFRQTFLVEIGQPIRLKTGARGFGLDDWNPPELDLFVSDYFARTPDAGAILVNYVFLSHCLTFAPDRALKLIDTHDRFGGRKDQYLPFRSEANFFHLDESEEALGLGRADVVIAIQPVEQSYFSGLIGRPASLLLPEIETRRPFRAPERLRAIGFMGHGNDANLVSIGSFIGCWGRRWFEGTPKLLIAGEICGALPEDLGPGVRKLGYVERIEDFFDAIDLVVAPILMGTGLKLKVIEAMAHGAPVIGTATAFEGMATDLPEHGLADVEAIVDRVFALQSDRAALARLTRGCSKVYADYESEARQAGKRLRSELDARCKAAIVAPDRPQEGAPQRRAFAFGQGAIIETLSRDSACVVENGDAVLAATEFIVLDRARPFEEAASARRRRWYVAPRRGAGDAVPGNPMAGRRVSLAPLLLCASGRPEDATTACLAASALQDAIPDWSANGAQWLARGDEFVMVFDGPAFLMRVVGSVRVFLTGRDPPAREAACTRISQSFAASGPASTRAAALTERCGDTAAVSILLAGRLRDATDPRTDAVLVVANGLWGRIDLVNPQA